MLAGESPLGGRTPQIIMARRQSEVPVSLRVMRETVPEGLDTAVLKALSRLPADRYASAGLYAEAVIVAASGASGAHVSASTPGLMPALATTTQTTATGPPASGDRTLSFWEELKRRKVINVAIVYLAVAWPVSEATQMFLGDWFDKEGMARIVIGAVAAGFPFALLLAWLFEVSREGVTKTGSYELVESNGQARRWPVVSRRAIAVVVVVLAIYGAWKLLGSLP
jgi:hypothetical protein